MFCRGIKGEFDFLREEFQKTVLVCPSLHCSLISTGYVKRSRE